MALEGTLIIAGPYNEETLQRIHNHFARLLKQEVNLTIKEDPKLIGGFIAIVDGKLYDSSMATQADRMQAHLAIRRY